MAKTTPKVLRSGSVGKTACSGSVSVRGMDLNLSVLASAQEFRAMFFLLVLVCFFSRPQRSTVKRME